MNPVIRPTPIRQKADVLTETSGRDALPGQPLITVLTATYNAAAHLPGLIASLRQQTDPEFEWIVVDGASSDETLELLGSASDVLTHCISEPDFGFYHALNKGIACVRTRYYLVLGADDRLEPNAIRLYREAAAASGADIIATPVRVGGKMVTAWKGQPWRRGSSAYISQHSVGTLIRTELHTQFGDYSSQFPVAADSYFIKKVMATPGIKVNYADFVSGDFGTGGLSSENLLLAMTDLYRIQMLTENTPILQTALFAWVMLKNFSRIVRQLKKETPPDVKDSSL